MSKVFQKVRTGINLGSLTADPSDPQAGDFYYNTVTNTFRQYISGAWHNIVGDDLVQLITNKQVGFSTFTDSTTTGSDASIASPTTGVVRLTNVSLVSIGGIPGGTPGLQVMLTNLTGNTITIINEDLSVATAANRILTGVGDVAMPNNAIFTFIYSGVLSRWQLVSSGGANTALSNLTPTAVNQSLNPTAVYTSVQAMPSTSPGFSGLDQQFAARFIPASNFSVGQVGFSITRNAATVGTMTAYIYSDSAGTPNAVLATSNPVPVASLSAGPVEVDFQFGTPFALTSGTTYYVAWGVTGVVAYPQINIGGTAVSFSDGPGWLALGGNHIAFAIYSSRTSPLTIGTAADPWDAATITQVNAGEIIYGSATDSTTTGSDATLAAFSTGIVRLTNGSLVSLGGIPAGTSGQQLIIENKTGNQLSIVNEDTGATAANRIQTGTGANASMANNASFEFVYDSTSSRWQLVGGTGSGGSGAKNYLTPIITSTSSGVPNVGNGNFEFGNTTGWSLAHSTLSSLFPTSVATAGTGFDSTHGGTAASGNLSLSTVTGGSQIDGSYSGSLVSSAASTAGDLLISKPFFIDASDQGKILPWAFNYKAVSGTFNFSGTSANTFAVYIYDVTNGAWISPVGVYNMVQSAGVGVATGSFVANSNSILYQIALININATAGAYSLTVDDFVVGSGSGASNNFGQGQAPTTTTISSGLSGTYTTPAGVQWIRVRMVGGGGGGGGSGSGTSGSAGNPGGSSVFGPFTATGGAGGFVGWSGSAPNATPGVGSGGYINLTGGPGQQVTDNGAFNIGGPAGGASFFGGAGKGSTNTSAGTPTGGNAAANSGSGGGAAGGGGTVQPAGSGAAGGYVEGIINNPAATYSWTLGTTGGGGAIGTSGGAGGSGASGIIYIDEYYSAPASGVSGQGIGVTGTVALATSTTTSQSIAAGGSTVTFATVTTDTNNSYNGVQTYTIPVSGIYNLSCVGYASPSANNAGTIFITIRKNASGLGPTIGTQLPSAGGQYAISVVQNGIRCNAGDTIDVFMSQSTTVTVLFTGLFSVVLDGGGVQATQNRVFAPPQLTSIAGSTTYTAPIGALYLKVTVHGGGGGGGPVTGSAGGTGGTTSLTGTGLNLVCTGGAGANPGNSPQSPPAGGTVTATTGLTVVYARSGGSGNSANNVTATAGMPGCAGWRGGAGGAGGVNIAGSAAATNSGAGGGGAGSSSGGGGGGAAGAILEGIIANPNPSITYTATIGAAGTAGAGAANGGAGGSGYIEIWAHFQ